MSDTTTIPAESIDNAIARWVASTPDKRWYHLEPEHTLASRQRGFGASVAVVAPGPDGDPIDAGWIAIEDCDEIVVQVREDGAIGVRFPMSFPVCRIGGESSFDAWVRQHNTPRRWDPAGSRVKRRSKRLPVGAIVRLTGKFLRDTGQHAGSPRNGLVVAHTKRFTNVQWCDRDEVTAVHPANLELDPTVRQRSGGC